MNEITLMEMAQASQFRLGNAQNREAGTGCTVLIFPKSAPCAVDVRGGGPASRESELLNPMAAASGIHAILLSGGSAFGLNASTGVMQYLEEKGIGFETRVCKVPLVVESCIYDLGCGDNVRPDAAMGYQACVSAEMNVFREGCYGAGTGATVGKLCGPDYMMKSGLGAYAVQVGELQVGAVVAVNAVGDVLKKDGTILAGMRSRDGQGFADTRRVMLEEYGKTPTLFSQRAVGTTTNTTIGAVITNGKFNKAQLKKIAALGSNGIVRTIRPVNTTADGDSLYAASVGNVSAELSLTGTIAAYVVEKAIRRAVTQAESLYGVPAVNG
ncbi:P1 family peptidase [uncultured Megasphaera sp.]|uniref:P1 family peptidase n=1 Tax=Megasphaera sp. TaxID=2023260 RepID=UPI002868DB60|nr:P1 family peptidase [uncultured Megasphaera sp.]